MLVLPSFTDILGDEWGRFARDGLRFSGVPLLLSGRCGRRGINECKSSTVTCAAEMGPSQEVTLVRLRQERVAVLKHVKKNRGCPRPRADLIPDSEGFKFEQSSLTSE